MEVWISTIVKDRDNSLWRRVDRMQNVTSKEEAEDIYEKHYIPRWLKNGYSVDMGDGSRAVIPVEFIKFFDYQVLEADPNAE